MARNGHAMPPAGIAAVELEAKRGCEGVVAFTGPKPKPTRRYAIESLVQQVSTLSSIPYLDTSSNDIYELYSYG